MPTVMGAGIDRPHALVLLARLGALTIGDLDCPWAATASVRVIAAGCYAAT